MESVKERIEKTLEGQPFGGFEGCERDEESPAYFVLSLFLNAADLEEIRPDLVPAELDKPLGEVGKYGWNVVFPLTERDSFSRGPFGRYGGIWFSYLAALAVD